ncbi:hypothetical protein [Hyalangium gracile]|uniref:hypothetical protein n=1 Tax=Hyalangium gracile TaxID=394092 RepID=UPI001CC9B738|nr:hypothetical protein [Hyalangium gracile]
MSPLIESLAAVESLSEAVEPTLCVKDVWTTESAPEEFLREVEDTLSGFLRENPEAWEVGRG